MLYELFLRNRIVCVSVNLLVGLSAPLLAPRYLLRKGNPNIFFHSSRCQPHSSVVVLGLHIFEGGKGISQELSFKWMASFLFPILNYPLDI